MAHKPGEAWQHLFPKEGRRVEIRLLPLPADCSASMGGRKLYGLFCFAAGSADSVLVRSLMQKKYAAKAAHGVPGEKWRRAVPAWVALFLTRFILWKRVGKGRTVVCAGRGMGVCVEWYQFSTINF